MKRSALLAALLAQVAASCSAELSSVQTPILFQETFADNAFAARGWYDTPGMTITSTEHLPGSTSALEVHFLPGATTPTWGGAARHAFQPTPTLYVSYWVKYSANWVGSGQIDHPHEFYVLSNLDGQYAPLANDWLTTYIETNFVNGAGAPRVALQDNRAINTSYGLVPINLMRVTENRSVSGCNGVVETNLFSECSGTYNDKQINRGGTVTFQASPGTGYKSNWNHVEAYFQINSIVAGVGLPDGVVQFWFNGTLVIDRHDVLFRAGARTSLNFAQFVIAPYIGVGSPVDQFMWVDNLTIATRRIGSAPPPAAMPPSPSSSSRGPRAQPLGAGTSSPRSLKDSAGSVLTRQTRHLGTGDSTVATVSGSGLSKAPTALSPRPGRAAPSSSRSTARGPMIE